MNNTLVVKIEIETLIGKDGLVDFKKMERLAMIVSNLNNSGRKVIVVSSGAIALGMLKLGMKEEPRSLIELQATAAIGQAELIKTYQRFFGEFNQIVAQVLITQDIMNYEERHKNASNTFSRLLEMGIIPVVNENDTVSTDDIVMADNYPIALLIANLAHAGSIIIKMQDDGMYQMINRGEDQKYMVNEEEIFNLVEMLSRKSNEEIKHGSFPASFEELEEMSYYAKI